MAGKKSWPRRITRYVGWLVGVLALALAVDVSVLAFPQIYMDNKAEAGAVVVYYDGVQSDEFDRLAGQINNRLSGGRFYESSRADRVFVFRDQSLYEKIVRLAFLKPTPQGFHLSILGNSYVSATMSRELGIGAEWRPQFSLWDGDLSHLAAHEIAHGYISDRIGRGVWNALPLWKQEGLPEYVANTSLANVDEVTSLANRIDVLLDFEEWKAVPQGRRPNWDRTQYEAWLMVEYSLDVEGMTLEQFIDPSVIEPEVYHRMVEWRQSQ